MADGYRITKLPPDLYSTRHVEDQCVFVRETKEVNPILSVCVYQRTNFSLNLIVLAIILIDIDNIVLAKVIAKIWETGNSATMKSDGARNEASHRL